MAFPFGQLISAGSSLLGGILGKKEADANIEMQKDFAKKGIQWRVADAKKAGVHPLYALGANTTSFSPVSVGSLGAGLSEMGQDISRAVEAVQSAPERMQSKVITGLQIERAKLENEMLKSQIAGQVASNVRNAQVGPAAPVMLPEKVQGPQRTTHVRVGGSNIALDPGTSDIGQMAEDRYGEGPASWAAGIAGMFNDALYNLKDKSFLEILKGIDDFTRVNKYWK